MIPAGVSVSHSGPRAYKTSDYRKYGLHFCQLDAIGGGHTASLPIPEGPFRPLTEDLLSGYWVQRYTASWNRANKVTGPATSLEPCERKPGAWGLYSHRGAKAMKKTSAEGLSDSGGGAGVDPISPASVPPREESMTQTMPLVDAIADAECLRRVILTEAWSAEVEFWNDVPECSNIELALHMDRGWLTRAINKGRAHEAAMRAMSLAHAAFRAIPGLRA